MARRWVVIGLSLALISGAGYLAHLEIWSEHESEAEPIELHAQFSRGAMHLHLNRYERSLADFDQILMLAPDLPEAHVNRGYSLIGLNRFEEAASAFRRALAIRPAQTNAYYGLAVAEEQLGRRDIAVLSMGKFLSLADPMDPHRRKAEAALWEWGALIKDHQITPGN